MRYCVKCGRQVEDSMNFCPSCGAQIPKEETHHTYEYGNGQYTQNQTEQRNFREQTVKEEGTDRVLAVLAYLGLLVFVPILSGSKSEFVRFHANQGLVLFICSVLWNALDWILSRFCMVHGCWDYLFGRSLRYCKFGTCCTCNNRNCECM